MPTPSPRTLVAAPALIATLAGLAAADVLPVTPYLSAADSPFASMSLGWFYLEDMEDGLLNTPGLSVVSNRPGTIVGAIPPNYFTDSVDGDDGVIDGSGQGGRSLGELNNTSTESLGYTFFFDPLVLGQFPTHAGIVWTDGGGGRQTTVDFYDAGGTLIASIPPTTTGDNSYAGTTAEDRFFGAFFEQGIGSFTIRTPSGTAVLEVDHIQYGYVPAPGSLLLLAGWGISGRRRR